MTDRYSTSINARDLTSRLNRLESSQANDAVRTSSSTMSTERRRPRASSLDSFRMPQFTKSSTMSTTDSSGSEFSQLRVTHAVPKTKTNHESVEVGVGGFSKPRVNQRSRRDTNASAKSQGGNEDFRYYGRHANQWLFNDFSVTDAVKKGWGRVFGKEKDEEGDWYEKRG
jgi:hypothetical protein